MRRAPPAPGGKGIGLGDPIPHCCMTDTPEYLDGPEELLILKPFSDHGIVWKGLEYGLNEEKSMVTGCAVAASAARQEASHTDRLKVRLIEINWNTIAGRIYWYPFTPPSLGNHQMNTFSSFQAELFS